MDNLITWIHQSIMFGTVILFGTLGETSTEKSGNLNLGIPGIMYLGGFAGFAAAYMYENGNPEPSFIVTIILSLTAAFAAAALGGLIYSFLTVTLRTNQNVTGLALTTFGTGVANFFGSYILQGATYTAAPFAYSVFSATIPGLSDGTGAFGRIFFSYGFLVYLAVLLAVGMHFFLKKTAAGLNLRSVGESPATADAAGINTTKYKYLFTCAGAGISGIGGLFFVLDYNHGMWATTGEIGNLGWLALALVIFATWKPLNAIWGAYLFGFLYWLYNYLPKILGVPMEIYYSDLIQTLPYVVTIIMLIVISARKKRENQPPESLGLSYFREER